MNILLEAALVLLNRLHSLREGCTRPFFHHSKGKAVQNFYAFYMLRSANSLKATSLCFCARVLRLNAPFLIRFSDTLERPSASAVN